MKIITLSGGRCDEYGCSKETGRKEGPSKKTRRKEGSPQKEIIFLASLIVFSFLWIYYTISPSSFDAVKKYVRGSWMTNGPSDDTTHPPNFRHPTL